MLISHGQENNEEAPNSLTRLMTTPVYHQLFPGSRKIWKALEVFLTRQDLLHLSICFHTIQSLQAWHSMAFHGIFHGINPSFEMPNPWFTTPAHYSAQLLRKFQRGFGTLAVQISAGDIGTSTMRMMWQAMYIYILELVIRIFWSCIHILYSLYI